MKGGQFSDSKNQREKGMKTTYNVIRERKTRPEQSDVIASFEDENDKRAAARVEVEQAREENVQFNFFVETVKES